METAFLYTVDTEHGLLLSDMVWERTQTVEGMPKLGWGKHKVYRCEGDQITSA